MQGHYKRGILGTGTKKLLIYVKNNTAYYMYKKGIEQKIQKYLQQQTGLDIRVVFQDIRLSEEQKQELSQKQSKCVLHSKYSK